MEWARNFLGDTDSIINTMGFLFPVVVLVLMAARLLSSSNIFSKKVKEVEGNSELGWATKKDVKQARLYE